MSKTDVSGQVQGDIGRMQKTFDQTVQTMNAKGQRFDHPFGAPFSGIWGNTLYKYQHDDDLKSAPLGPLFGVLYGVENYRDIQECYGQAEIVLDALKGLLGQLEGKWEFGIVEVPGHYWACARGNAVYVHMDPWKNSFRVSKELKDGLRSPSFSPRFHTR